MKNVSSIMLDLCLELNAAFAQTQIAEPQYQPSASRNTKASKKDITTISLGMTKASMHWFVGLYKEAIRKVRYKFFLKGGKFKSC